MMIMALIMSHACRIEMDMPFPMNYARVSPQNFGRSDCVEQVASALQRCTIA